MTSDFEEGYRDVGSIPGNVHDMDGHHVVMEYPTSDDVVDSYSTSWGSGAFDAGLRAMLPPLVWNHNADAIIGRTTRFQNLGDRLQLTSRFADFDAVPQARAAYSMIRDGIVPGASFHFREGRTVAHPTRRGVRKFVSARMVEHGPVTFPAIPGAGPVGIRSGSPMLGASSDDEWLRRRFKVTPQFLAELEAERRARADQFGREVLASEQAQRIDRILASRQRDRRTSRLIGRRR